MTNLHDIIRDLIIEVMTVTHPNPTQEKEAEFLAKNEEWIDGKTNETIAYIKTRLIGE